MSTPSSFEMFNKPLDLEALNRSVHRARFVVAAWDYAEAGLPVFPLQPRGKKPLLGSRGFKDATIDAATIHDWWAANPEANIGIPTGLPSTFTSLDVDVKEWLEKRGDISIQLLQDAHGALPETVRQRTWSGGWQDLYLSVSGLRNSAGEIGDGLDVRGEGGYIVAPPSEVEEDGRAGTYAWVLAPGDVPLASMPDWLVQLAKTPQRPGRQSEPGAPIPKGQRNNVLYRTGRALATKVCDLAVVAAALLEMNRTRCQPPLADDEVRKIAQHCVEEGHRSDFKGRGSVGGEDRHGAPASSIGVRWASDVEAVPIEWLYEDGSLAIGKVLALVGDPGCGKTLIAEDLTARITTGSKWATEGVAPLGNVLLFEVEDAESDTTKPRLIAHGADCSKVALYGPEHGFVLDEDGTKRFLNLERDLPALRNLIVETQAKLVVISPLMSFLGKQDTKGDAEVRAVLTPLMGLAAELRVAILVIIHLNKNSDRAAMHRVQGSVAFVAGPRMVRICAKDPSDKGRYLMMRLKTSNSPDSGEALAYRIVSWCWRCHQEAGGKYCIVCGEYSTGRLLWDGIVEGVDPDEILSPKKPGGHRGHNQAAALLAEMVPADGARVLARLVYAEAERRGISVAAVKNARFREGISAEKGTFSGGWEWWRPGTPKVSD